MYTHTCIHTDIYMHIYVRTIKHTRTYMHNYYNIQSFLTIYITILYRNLEGFGLTEFSNLGKATRLQRL